MFFLVGPNVPPHLIDILIIEGSQNNLREDTLERCPGPQTRLIQKPRYEGDELIEYKSTNTDANSRGPQTRQIQKPRYEGD